MRPDHRVVTNVNITLVENCCLWETDNASSSEFTESFALDRFRAYGAVQAHQIPDVRSPPLQERVKEANYTWKWAS